MKQSKISLRHVRLSDVGNTVGGELLAQAAATTFRRPIRGLSEAEDIRPESLLQCGSQKKVLELCAKKIKDFAGLAEVISAQSEQIQTTTLLIQSALVQLLYIIF
jgi:hypothetical protein